MLLGKSVIKCRAVSYLKFPRRTFLTDFYVEKKIIREQKVSKPRCLKVSR